jgi:hypothetical protein
MKAKCFAHIDALRSSISRPHQKFSLLAPPQPHSASAQVDAERPNLFEQAPPDREASTPWRLLGRVDQPGLDTMIEPAEYSSDQRQRLIPNPPRLRLAPIRQNPSAKVIDVRETIDCILIGSKPARSEPNIVVREQKDVPAEFRDRPIPSVGKTLSTFRGAPDR